MVKFQWNIRFPQGDPLREFCIYAVKSCITAQLLAGTPALDVQSILLCGGVQLGLLLLAGGIWMYNLSGRNLMQRSAKIRNTTTAAMSGA